MQLTRVIHNTICLHVWKRKCVHVFMCVCVRCVLVFKEYHRHLAIIPSWLFLVLSERKNQGAVTKKKLLSLSRSFFLSFWYLVIDLAGGNVNCPHFHIDCSFFSYIFPRLIFITTECVSISTVCCATAGWKDNFT